MAQVIEGKFDFNGETQNQQLDEAHHSVINDYNRNVLNPALQVINENRKAAGMDEWDILFTPHTEDELAIIARFEVEMREQGYVKHVGDYEYWQTPRGNTTFNKEDRTAIVVLGEGGVII